MQLQVTIEITREEQGDSVLSQTNGSGTSCLDYYQANVDTNMHLTEDRILILLVWCCRRWLNGS